MNGLQILEQAFQMATITQPGEPLAAADVTTGMLNLNMFLGKISVDINPLWAVETYSNTLIAGQAAYTIGPSGLYTSKRPLAFQIAQFSLSIGNTPVNQNLIPLSPGDLASLSLPTVPSVPIYFSYNPTIPNGTITIYPPPVASYPVNFVYFVALDNADINTNYAFPPGYDLMVISNLAEMLCIYYGRTADSVYMPIARMASSTLRTITSANQAALAMDPSTDGSVPGLTNSNGRYIWPGIIQT